MADKLNPVPELHILNLPHRVDRMDSILHEVGQQGISSFRLWNGIYTPDYPATGISQGHKQIIRYAKENQLPFVVIAEDDIEFTAPGAFAFFINQMPENYDVFLGAVSYAKINQDNTLSDFSGLLLYSVHERFYNIFIDVPENIHIDRGLKNKGVFKLCDPFVVIEKEGFSDNSRRYEDNIGYYAGRPLFGRNSL